MPDPAKPKVAVFKFASCDGCQLTLLNLEDELLAVAGKLDIAYFPEATSTMQPPPYDVALVEGSIITAGDAERIQQVRRDSKLLVAIGACSTTGGIQALRNLANIDEMIGSVYARPEFIKTLATSTPISDHVKVDLTLSGCPIDKQQLLEVIVALCTGKTPDLPTFSLCMECKRHGNVCVTVTEGIPCLGPLTQAGCGALCPSYARGCFGCFGPMEASNPDALAEHWMENGIDRGRAQRLLRGFTGNAEVFRAASQKLEVLPR